MDVIPDVNSDGISCIEHRLFAAWRIRQGRRFQLADDLNELRRSDEMWHNLSLKQKLKETDDRKFLLQYLDLIPCKL